MEKIAASRGGLLPPLESVAHGTNQFFQEFSCVRF